MKTLYFLRHAKAEPGDKNISDPERVLSARGREACGIIGAYMKAKQYMPGFTLSSPSARTKETLELVREAAGMKSPFRFEKTLYLAAAEEILQHVHGLEDGVASALLVGHNPGMHHISLLLSSPKRTPLRAELELKFPTCALAVLRFDAAARWEEIAPGHATLADFVTPGEL